MLLNKDIKQLHNFHRAVTSHLHDEDPTNPDQRKLSMCIPSLIIRGIKILSKYTGSPNQGVPSSTRNIHDCDQDLDAMHIMLSHNGAIVSGLSERNDNMYKTAGTCK